VYMQLVNMGVPLTWSLVDAVTTHDPRFQACPFGSHKADALVGQQMPIPVHHMCPSKPAAYTNMPAEMCQSNAAFVPAFQHITQLFTSEPLRLIVECCRKMRRKLSSGRISKICSLQIHSHTTCLSCSTLTFTPC